MSCSLIKTNPRLERWPNIWEFPLSRSAQVFLSTGKLAFLLRVQLWPYSTNVLSRARNTLAYLLLDWLLIPITRVLNDYRHRWHLAPLKGPDDSFFQALAIGANDRRLRFPKTVPDSKFLIIWALFVQRANNQFLFPGNAWTEGPSCTPPWGPCKTAKPMSSWPSRKLARPCSSN